MAIKVFFDESSDAEKVVLKLENSTIQEGVITSTEDKATIREVLSKEKVQVTTYSISETE